MAEPLYARGDALQIAIPAGMRGTSPQIHLKGVTDSSQRSELLFYIAPTTSGFEGVDVTWYVTLREFELALAVVEPGLTFGVTEPIPTDPATSLFVVNTGLSTISPVFSITYLAWVPEQRDYGVLSAQQRSNRVAFDK